jgi:hypothetical protein
MISLAQGLRDETTVCGQVGQVEDTRELGGGVDATVTLWKRCRVKVVSGAFPRRGPGWRQSRRKMHGVALVPDPATIMVALERITVSAVCSRPCGERAPILTNRGCS